MPETLTDKNKSHHLHLPTIFKNYVSIIKNIKFISLCCVTFLPIIGLICWLLAGPFIVVNMFDYTTLDFGIMQGFVFGSLIVGTQVVKHFATLERNAMIVKIGLSCNFIGSGMAMIIGLCFPHFLLVLVFSLMILTFGCGLCAPILSRITLEQSTDPMGTTVSIFSLFRISSGVVGSIILTSLYSGTLFSLGFIIFIFVVIAIALKLLTRV